MRRKTLIDRLARNLARDPQDAPVVDVQAAVDAQDLGYELDWADRQLSAHPPDGHHANSRSVSRQAITSEVPHVNGDVAVTEVTVFVEN